MTPLSSTTTTFTTLATAEFEQVLTPPEFAEVYLRILALGHPDRITEDAVEKLLGHEIFARLKVTVRMVKAAVKAAAAKGPVL